MTVSLIPPVGRRTRRQTSAYQSHCQPEIEVDPIFMCWSSTQPFRLGLRTSRIQVEANRFFLRRRYFLHDMMGCTAFFCTLKVSHL